MTTTIIWFVRILVLTSTWPVLAAGSNQVGDTVNISIYNLAHIRSKTLEQAEGLASQIFAVAGIEARWTTGPASIPKSLVSDFSAITGSECGKPLDSTVVRVKILLRAPNGFASQALGYSLPCAQRGVQVTIYADRVEAVSDHTPAVFYRVLGHTLAHELGHVLLRSLTHEKSGLMKGVWSKNDWQRAAVASIPFMPDQAKRMTESLHRIESQFANVQSPKRKPARTNLAGFFMFQE